MAVALTATVAPGTADAADKIPTKWGTSTEGALGGWIPEEPDPDFPDVTELYEDYFGFPVSQGSIEALGSSAGPSGSARVLQEANTGAPVFPTDGNLTISGLISPRFARMMKYTMALSESLPNSENEADVDLEEQEAVEMFNEVLDQNRVTLPFTPTTWTDLEGTGNGGDSSGFQPSSFGLKLSPEHGVTYNEDGISAGLSMMNALYGYWEFGSFDASVGYQEGSKYGDSSFDFEYTVSAPEGFVPLSGTLSATPKANGGLQAKVVFTDPNFNGTTNLSCSTVTEAREKAAEQQAAIDEAEANGEDYEFEPINLAEVVNGVATVDCGASSGEPLVVSNLTLAPALAKAIQGVDDADLPNYTGYGDLIFVDPVKGGSNEGIDPATALAPRGKVTINASGLAPNTTHDVVVESTPVKVGTLTTNSSGNGTATVTLPEDLTDGTHHIKLIDDGDEVWSQEFTASQSADPNKVTEYAAEKTPEPTSTTEPTTPTTEPTSPTTEPTTPPTSSTTTPTTSSQPPTSGGSMDLGSLGEGGFLAALGALLALGLAGGGAFAVATGLVQLPFPLPFPMP